MPSARWLSRDMEALPGSGKVGAVVWAPPPCVASSNAMASTAGAFGRFMGPPLSMRTRPALSAERAAVALLQRRGGRSREVDAFDPGRQGTAGLGLGIERHRCRLPP